MTKKGNKFLLSSVAASNETTAEWKLVRLRDLGKWSGGGTPSKANPAFWENGTIPWVSPKDMKVDRIFTAEDLITEAAVKGSTTNLVPAGSILMVTRSGILRHTFPVAVTEVQVTLNQDLKALTLAPGVLPKYVLFALKAFSQDILHTCSKQGTTVNSIETEQLLSFEIPLAPPELQERIVAEIEKELSRLDQAVTVLKRIQANLKRYKAAVLKAAVEGKLTEQWRKEHPDVEPADQLLKHILAERRAKWEAEELAKMEAKGITSKGDSWKKKYKEPTGPGTVNLAELPGNWVLATIEQLAALVTDGDHNPPKRSATGVPHLTAKHVRDWRLDPTDCTYISRSDAEKVFKRYLPQAGDLLVTCVGTVGRTAIIPRNFEFSPDRNLAAIRLLPDSANARLIQLIVESPNIQKYIKTASGSTAQPHLYLSDLRALSIPLPPLMEQDQIIETVDHHLSIINDVDNTIKINIKRAARLRQTILQMAFSGGQGEFPCSVCTYAHAGK